MRGPRINTPPENQRFSGGDPGLNPTETTASFRRGPRMKPRKIACGDLTGVPNELTGSVNTQQICRPFGRHIFMLSRILAYRFSQSQNSLPHRRDFRLSRFLSISPRRRQKRVRKGQTEPIAAIRRQNPTIYPQTVDTGNAISYNLSHKVGFSNSKLLIYNL